MPLLADAELSQDTSRPEPEPPAGAAGVRGALRRSRHAADGADHGEAGTCLGGRGEERSFALWMWV